MMTVYEATTMKDYKRIEEFLKSEPEDAIVHHCWKAFGGTSAEWLKKMKDDDPNLHIYYVTDEVGDVRLVYAEGEYGEISKQAYAFMSQEDWDNRMFDFWMELLPFVFERNIERGVKIKRIQATKWLADKCIKWLGKDLVKIVETREAPTLGTYYVLEANVKECLLRLK